MSLLGYGNLMPIVQDSPFANRAVTTRRASMCFQQYLLLVNGNHTKRNHFYIPLEEPRSYKRFAHWAGRAAIRVELVAVH